VPTREATRWYRLPIKTAAIQRVRRHTVLDGTIQEAVNGVKKYVCGPKYDMHKVYPKAKQRQSDY